MRHFVVLAKKSVVTVCGSMTILASCITSPGSKVAPAPIRFDTLEKVQAGGLNEKDLTVLRAFLRRAGGSKNPTDTVINPSQRKDIELCLSYYPKPADLDYYRLYDGEGLSLGVIYSASADQIYVVNPARLHSCSEMTMRKMPEGYLFTLIQGCVHVALKVVTSHGRPYVIKYPTSDELR